MVGPKISKTQGLVLVVLCFWFSKVFCLVVLNQETRDKQKVLAAQTPGFWGSLVAKPFVFHGFWSCI